MARDRRSDDHADAAAGAGRRGDARLSLLRPRPGSFATGFRTGLLLAGLGLAIVPGAGRLARSWRYRAAVTGSSMGPGLRPGDWLLVDPAAYRRRSPRAGEIVVVPDPRAEERWLVKRVSEVGPDGSLVLAGDDPDSSTDSRTFGSVDPGTVVGRAWARYWPPGRWGAVR